jgi:hypothetical protein
VEVEGSTSTSFPPPLLLQRFATHRLRRKGADAGEVFRQFVIVEENNADEGEEWQMMGRRV